MKTMLKKLSVVLVSVMMLTPVVDAQRPSSRSNNSSQSSSRPGQNSGNQHSTRPGNGNGNSTRPGNNGNGNATRPGSQKPGRPTQPTQPAQPGGSSVRPGNNHGGQVGGSQVRPTAPVRPGDTSVRPGYQSGRPVTVAPPVRPYRPQFNTWTRPVVPNGWTPRYRQPLFADILGLTIGVNLNYALDYLYNTGYSVDGYGQQEIYLRNVLESGYRWDDATLYFSSGMMVRSQFYDMTAGYSPSRYYDLYNQYCVRYGAPATQVSNQGYMTATWFGYNGEYVMLQYSLMSTSSGQRYVTQLILGN